MTNLMTASAMDALDVLLKGSEEFLEVGVSGGGCAGLQISIGKGSMKDISELSIKMTGTGGRVRFADLMSQTSLAGGSIDYEDTGVSKGFVVIPPPDTKSCGCGSSFIPKSWA